MCFPREASIDQAVFALELLCSLRTLDPFGQSATEAPSALSALCLCQHAPNACQSSPAYIAAWGAAVTRPLVTLPSYTQSSQTTASTEAAMPTTGRGRAVHATPAKHSDKSRSVESMQPPRRESLTASSSTTLQRPAIKGRAYSTPIVPQHQPKTLADDNASLYSHDGEEIADDAFFQRYHFPQPVETTKEEASESDVDSSSDTEGPLSPTHVRNRQPSAQVASGPSSGVGCFFFFFSCAQLDQDSALTYVHPGQQQRRHTNHAGHEHCRHWCSRHW
jgi:hypothetical protein